MFGILQIAALFIPSHRFDSERDMLKNIKTLSFNGRNMEVSSIFSVRGAIIICAGMEL